MTYQKKNLLEAFQASAAASKARAQEGASKDVPRASGPFARQAPQPAAEEQAELEHGPAPRARLQLDGRQRLIVLQVLIATAAFFLGRASVSTVGASGGDARAEDPSGSKAASLAGAPAPSAESTAAPAPVQSRGEVSTVPGTPAERALQDPANRYTIKLVEYEKGPDDEVALATLRWLESQGLPAAAKFQGSRLFILLGAAPTQKELDALLATAKSMNGPPPRDKPSEFHDAYVVGIERLGIR